jgi:hypothetical protein
MRVLALKKLIKLNAITTCTIPSKTFVSLPFMGGISVFAVILPKPHRETLDGMDEAELLRPSRL